MNTTTLRLLAALSIAAPLATYSIAQPRRPRQNPPPSPTAPQTPTPPAPPPVKPNQPKPYAEVVTKEAITQDGMFKVHRIEDKILFEIPESKLNREMLWQTEIAQVPATGGFLYPGTAAGSRVVKWTRRNNTVFLRMVSFNLRASTKDGLEESVAAASLAPMIAAFPIEAIGDKKSMVIDVTRLFTTDPQEFQVKPQLGATGVDPSRSYVDRVSAFPTNVETRSMLTFNGQRGAVSALVHYSLTELPEMPMMGRLRDSRVGYFATGFTTYGRPENRALDQQFISRFRLEKKDPSAAMSDPVKPIVFYVSREVPARWRGAVSKAIEDWQPAFAQAGFSNAIIAKDAPSVKEDPTWDPEDARYSVIRWAPSPIENAMGPSVQDPRSGETISAHIIIWHNMLLLVENWYFAQVAAIDPRARTIPFPDSLMNELVRYVVSHEVGHTLGLEHNFKASSAYSVKQLRDPVFTKQYAMSPSIMDYSRFNYVAQPGDNAQTIPIVGEYDKFAIEWGYKPLPGAYSPDDEKRALDAIAARQVSNPALRFGNSRGEDPTAQTEDIGGDAIEASTLGFQNLKRTVRLIVPAAAKPGEDYSQVARLYGEVMGQMTLEAIHVARNVGGVEETDYHAGRGGAVFTPTPRDKQQRAVKFLLDNVMWFPKEMLDPQVVDRIQSSGVMDRALGLQRIVLSVLLSEDRVKRMAESQAVRGNGVYTVRSLVSDLQNGIWSELLKPSPVIEPMRRALQRQWIQTIAGRCSGPSASGTDLKPIGLDGLLSLKKKILTSLPTVTDEMTKLHLQQSLRDIADVFNPNRISVGASVQPPPFFLDGWQGCWDNGLTELLRATDG